MWTMYPCKENKMTNMVLELDPANNNIPECKHEWKPGILTGKYVGEYKHICVKCGYVEIYEKDYT